MNLPNLTRLLAQTDADAALPTVAPEPGSFWLPPQSSTSAPTTDLLFYYIYWISVFFFILIVALMVIFVIRYRRRREGERGPVRTTHNTALEITWSGIPLLLVLGMFYLGLRGYMDLANPPAGAMDVYVQGQKWFWTFTYPNGYSDTELHVPVDTPVRLILQSTDVIHSFFVPAFRIKRDAVPGRYNIAWFEATEPGEYLALCAEYCGTQHSDMLARVVVHKPGYFEKWMKDAMNLYDKGYAFHEIGEMIHKKRCASCHSIDGSASIGPTFKGLWMRKAKLNDGTPYTVNENYIRESIMDPMAKVVAGYDPVMPTFKGQLSDRDITAIIEYAKVLSGVESTVVPESEGGAAEGADDANAPPAEETGTPVKPDGEPPPENDA